MLLFPAEILCAVNLKDWSNSGTELVPKANAQAFGSFHPPDSGIPFDNPCRTGRTQFPEFTGNYSTTAEGLRTRRECGSGNGLPVS